MSTALPLDIYNEIILYLTLSDISLLGTANKALNVFVARRMYRRVEFPSETTRETLISFFWTMERRKDHAEIVEYLYLDWTSRPERNGTIASYMVMTLPSMTHLKTLFVSPTLDIWQWVFDDIHLPSLREFSLCKCNQLSATFFKRHPELTKVHMGLCRPLTRHKPFVLEGSLEKLTCLRTCSAEFAIQVLDHMPHDLTRLDLGEINDDILILLASIRYSTAKEVSRINVYGDRALSSLISFASYKTPLRAVRRIGLGWSTPYTNVDPTTLLRAAACVFPCIQTLDIVLHHNGHYYPDDALARKVLENDAQLFPSLNTLLLARDRVLTCPQSETRDSRATRTFSESCDNRDWDYPFLPWQQY